MDSKNYYLRRVGGVYIEQDNVWMKVHEYLNYIAYWNSKITENTFLHEVFKSLKETTQNR